MTAGPEPSRFARCLVRRLSPKAERDGIEGDLIEAYGRRAERDAQAARRWLRREIARSCVPLAVASLVDATAIRWLAGLALGILVTTYGPDAIVGVVLGGASGGGVDPRAVGAALCLAVVGGYWSARVAGARHILSLGAIVGVLYGPAVIPFFTSPAAPARDVVPLLVIGCMAFAGGLLGRRPPAHRGSAWRC